MITGWRLCEAKWQRSAFSGGGAAEWPGRWNSSGTKIGYASESRALAALEVLANVKGRAQLSRIPFVLVPIRIPEELVLPVETLPLDWRAIPLRERSQAIGDRFIREGIFPVMRVPSVIVPGEFNYLLNPAHPRFGELEIGNAEVFSFDDRMGG